MQFDRRVNARRKQLVIVIADESSSMAGAKAQAATEGIREMLYRCQTVGPEGISLFRMAIICFADNAWTIPGTEAAEVWDIDPDLIELHGESGGTNMEAALVIAERLLAAYNKRYLAKHPEPEKHPLPLVIFFSDGHNGYRPPLAAATRIKEMSMAGGVPTLVTVGVAVGFDLPDVTLLRAMASVDQETSRPCYFEVEDVASLTAFLAAVGSSAASSPKQVFQSTALVPAGRTLRSYR